MAVPSAVPMFSVVAAPAKLTVVAVVLNSVNDVAAVARVGLLNVAVPVVAPMASVVAAPAKLTVVAVVLTSANVVDGVVIGDVTAMPTANGTLAVVVCVPSFSTHVERPVERSDHVVCAALLLIVVPVTGEGANELLLMVNTPAANGVKPPAMVKS